MLDITKLKQNQHACKVKNHLFSERERNRTTDKDKMRLTVFRTELQTIPLSPLSLKSDLRMEKHECVSFCIHYD